MKIAFVHDSQFSILGKRVFVNGDFSYDEWKVYLDTFGQLRFVARSQTVDEADTLGMSRSDGPGVSFRGVPSASTLASLLSSHRAVRRAIRDAISGVDAVIARVPSILGMLAVAEARRADIPYAVEVVGCPWDSYWNHGTVRGRVLAPYMHLWMRRVVRGAPFALYVSEHFLQRRYPSTGVQIGISNARPVIASAAIVAGRFEARPDPAVSPLRIGLVGTLGPKYKGVDTLIDAARILAGDPDVPPFQVRVLGPGDPAPWQAIARASGVADRVSFDGVLPSGEGVRNWLDGIDIYAQPSRAEGIARAVVEALGRGLPVVGSSVGGLVELIPEERRHAPGDAEGLAAVLRPLLTDPAARRRAAEESLSQAARFDPSRARPRWDGFWRAFREFAEQARATATRDRDM